MVVPYRPLEAGLQRRFWQAFYSLGIPLSRFCDEACIRRQKYQQMKKEVKEEHFVPKRYIDGSALVWMCMNYGISANWLLKGRGKMYANY